jgi:uncharacterized membrane protein
VIRSLLIGAVAGMRSMTPIAAVSTAQNRGHLPDDNGAPALLGHPLVSAGLLALAAGELVGDKLPSAPDRIIAPGLAARLVTGAVAGAALAPREQRVAAAALGAFGAVAASYLTFNLRVAAMRRFGQVPTGLVEDAIAVGAAVALMRGAEQAAQA